MYITVEDRGGTLIILYIYIYVQYTFLLIEVVLMLSPLHLKYVLILILNRSMFQTVGSNTYEVGPYQTVYPIN